MMEHPITFDIPQAIKEIDTGKAPKCDGIPIEIYPQEDDNLATMVYLIANYI